MSARDVEELESSRDAIIAFLRKLGWDGIVFWLVEAIPIAALATGTVVFVVVLIRRHRRLEREAAHDGRAETAATDDTGPDLSQC